MQERPDPNTFRAYIYNKMQEKETEELLAIWQENDRNIWTEEALEIVRDILIERLGQIPDKVLQSSAVNPDAGENNTIVSTMGYPADKKLIWIADWSNILSWAILIVTAIYSILRLAYQFINYLTISQSAGNHFFDVAFPIVDAIYSLIYAGFIYFVLQAITEIIYLLMDIRDYTQPEFTQSEDLG
jgi:hypothetical protein